MQEKLIKIKHVHKHLAMLGFLTGSHPVELFIMTMCTCSRPMHVHWELYSPAVDQWACLSRNENFGALSYIETF